MQARNFLVTLAAIGLAAPLAESSPQLRVQPPVRVDHDAAGSEANETTVSTSSANPLVGVTGWNDYRTFAGRSYFGVTRDGGATWSEHELRPPLPFQSIGEGDPMGAFDAATGTLWAGAISFFDNGGIYAARLDPGATDFGAPVMIQASSSVDKGWMAAGPDPADVTKTRVYAAYNFGVARSEDMGDTWLGPVSLGPGVGFLPKTGPLGELYVAYWDLDAKHLLRRSFDGGVTFGPPITIVDRMDVYGTQINDAVVGGFRVPSLQGLTVDQRTGHLYCVYIDTTSRTGSERDVDVYFTKSVDRGANWSLPTVVNGDSPFEQDQFFPWIEVDETGGLHVVFMDTRHNAQVDDSITALLDTYYAFSADDGQSWTEARLTPESWDTADVTSTSPFPFVGDYLGLSAVGGRVMATYPVASPGNSTDILASAILHGPVQAVCRGILCPCGNDDPKAGCGNSGIDGDPSTGAALGGAGSPSVAADDLVLEITGLAPNQFALLFAGTGQGNALIGDGRLCIGGSLNRYPVAQADGAGVVRIGPGAVVRLAQVAAASFAPRPGETWYYQAVYRDGSSPCGNGFNVTSAASVLWE